MHVIEEGSIGAVVVSAVADASFSVCMLPLPDADAWLCFVLPEALLIDGNMWDEAVITQKAKVKQLEDKYSAKMLENSVCVITSFTILLSVVPTMHLVFPTIHWTGFKRGLIEMQIEQFLIYATFYFF